jgi:prolyl-tRNA synthetase
MKFSQLVTKTKKTSPAEEQALNARLLIRAGYIHKEMAGVYSYLPLGLRVIEKIKNIVREEMNAVGGQEILMSTLQPKELWELTDRWDDKKVDNWFKTKLLNGSELGIGLTHEEPVVNALKDYIVSYKDLPVKVYQIQSKYRNELRAKSGLLRGREFIMKDMYSFSTNSQQHDQQYEEVVAAYLRIYERLGLGDITYRTYADGGIFTKKFSDEFQVISDIGEDTIYLDQKKRIGVNQEIYNPLNLKKLNLKPEDLITKKAVEVGNTFHLESKYSDALGMYYTDEKGQKQSLNMGCYGIGISRLMGVIVEHFADQKGLVWPSSIAPFSCYVTAISDNPQQIQLAQNLYKDLTANLIGVIYDDRYNRPAEKFADCDLLGIPIRIVVNQKSVDDHNYEIKLRNSAELFYLNHSELLDYLKRKDQ